MPNFGAGSGVKSEDIAEFFRSNTSGFQEVYLFDKHTYALLSFDTLEDAQKAQEAFHLTETTNFGGKVMLLLLFHTKLTKPKSSLNENVHLSFFFVPSSPFLIV